MATTTPKPETIEDLWEDFRKKTIRKDASPEQLFEMRAVFYAGAFSSLMIMTQIATEGVSNDVASTRLQSLHTEVEKFTAFLIAKGFGL